MAIIELENAFYTTLFLYFAYLYEITYGKTKKITQNEVCKNNLEITKKEACNSFCQPIIHYPVIRFMIPNISQTINHRLDILSYYDIAKTYLKENYYKNNNVKYLEDIHIKNIISRCLANDLLIIFKITNTEHIVQTNECSHIYQPIKDYIVPHWTKQDYRFAANFFRNKYNVIREHPLKKILEFLPEKPDQWPYTLLKKYQKLFCSKQLEQLTEIRKKITENKQSHNKN